MRKYSEKTDKFRRKHTFEFCFNEIESFWILVLIKKKKGNSAWVYFCFVNVFSKVILKKTP